MMKLFQSRFSFGKLTLVYIVVVTLVSLVKSTNSHSNTDAKLYEGNEVDLQSSFVQTQKDDTESLAEIEIPDISVLSRKKRKVKKEKGEKEKHRSRINSGRRNREEVDRRNGNPSRRPQRPREKTRRSKDGTTFVLREADSEEPNQPKGRHNRNKNKGVKSKHGKSKTGGKSKHKRPKNKSKSGEVLQPESVPDGPWIRLSGGERAGEGRIEVYVDESWGSLCDDGFDLTDAAVACRQLGYSQGAESIVTDNRFGYGQLDIAMDDIECDGSEQKLQDCTFIEDHNCGRLTEVAGVICNQNAETNTCPEDKSPGLLTESTPNLQLGISGQNDHELVYNLQQLLSGGEPIISTESKLQMEIWMQDTTEISHLEMTIMGVKKVWIFTNYRDGTHSRHIILPIEYMGSSRTWRVQHSFDPNDEGANVNGFTLVLENADLLFSLVELKVFACMDQIHNANCPMNSGLPVLLHDGTPDLIVAVDGDQHHEGVESILQLMSGGYILEVGSTSVEVSVWRFSGEPLSHYHIALVDVDSLRINYYYSNDRSVQKDIIRPGGQHRWSVEEFFQRNSGGYPVIKLGILFGTRRRKMQFVINSFQVYACSPPTDSGPDEEPTMECYEGDGASYRGTIAITDKGTTCMNWILGVTINATTHPFKGLGNHNLCRNPDGDQRPWCWVEPGVFGYCNIPVCVNSSMTSVTEPSTTRTPCTDTEFRCNSGVCIPGRWKCDGGEDCMNGEDEESCENVLDLFQHFPGQKLQTPKEELENYYDVTYLFTGLQQCAKICVETRDFICRGFNYNAEDKTCVLYSVNAGLVGLAPSEHTDFYQLTSQAVDCTEDSQFMCDNGKCIELHHKCNGVDNCNDFSDEVQCSGAPTPLEVKLVGGQGEHEGQVLIRYMNEWGAICDDAWDIKDANVVCRQLGYEAALKATVMSQFGSNPNILLDEVHCNGTELLIEDCQHSQWRDHDCQDFETAGVQCRVGKVCSSDQFPCGSGRSMTCVPVSYVCDGENDCTDASDESDCDAIEVLLLDGHSDHEGRIEIIRNGIQGTVCDDSFDNYDAIVVCRMLGYEGTAVAVAGGKFGPGTGPIWVDDLECSGTERELSECTHRGWASHNCMHTEDVGVRCYAHEMTTARPTKQPTTTTVPGSTQEPPVCGRKFMNQGPSLRIVGGFQALYGAYPWQAGLRIRKGFNRYTHWCGGTIISDQWILSAAHCYHGKMKNDFKVRVGDWDNEMTDEFEQEFEVEEIYLHEQYDATTYDYDLALIKLQPRNRQRITFYEKVQPACLPDVNQDYRNGTKCWISGWGSTGSNHGIGVYPSNLQAAQVPLIHRTECMRLYKSSVTERMHCAGYIEGNIDSCQGDSGGPLVCRVNGQYTVLGVTSWGHGCAAAYAPGVYSKVTKFLTWIAQKMNK